MSDSSSPSYDDFEPSSEQASETLSQVGSEDTEPELLLRKTLWARGLRYRLHRDDLPGSPDIVFPTEKVAVFCDGDFWHGRNWEERKQKLKEGSNPGYWIPKIRTNMERDERQTEELENDGWTVIRLWETDIKQHPEQAADRVEALVRQNREQ